MKLVFEPHATILKLHFISRYIKNNQKCMEAIIIYPVTAFNYDLSVN